MKILVLGGAGYVGSMLVPTLIANGNEVHVLDAYWFGDHLPKEAIRESGPMWGLTKKEMEGYEQVLFLAGLSNDPMAEFDPAGNFIHNSALPTYTAYIAKQAGVKRFIFASSCSIYGYTEGKIALEDSPTICQYPYGISKAQAEAGLIQLQDDTFSVIALRQGTIGGHSPRMRFDLLVNAMFKSAWTEGKITISNPSLWRPVVDIRDVVSGWVCAIRADYNVHGIFNLASNNYTLRQVAWAIHAALDELGYAHTKIVELHIPDKRNYRASSAKAKEVLEFLPLYGVKSTVRDLYDHVKEYGDFTNEKFYNIKVFSRLGDLTRRDV